MRLETDKIRVILQNLIQIFVAVFFKIIYTNHKVEKTSEISSRTSFSTSFSKKSKDQKKAPKNFSINNSKANQKVEAKLKNEKEDQVSKKISLQSRYIKLTDENKTKPTSVAIDSDEAPELQSSPQSQVSADFQEIAFADTFMPNPNKPSTPSKFERMSRLGSFKNHKARLKRAESVTKDEIDKPLVKKKMTLEEYLKEELRIRENFKFKYEKY